MLLLPAPPSSSTSAVLPWLPSLSSVSCALTSSIPSISSPVPSSASGSLSSSLRSPSSSTPVPLSPPPSIPPSSPSSHPCCVPKLPSSLVSGRLCSSSGSRWRILPLCSPWSASSSPVYLLLLHPSSPGPLFQRLVCPTPLTISCLLAVSSSGFSPCLVLLPLSPSRKLLLATMAAKFPMIC